MFKIGERVKVKISGKAGTVKAVFPAEYWNLVANGGDDEYTIEFDDGEGAVNLRENLLELIYVPRCTCGLKFVRHGGLHSDYCDLYEKD